MRAAIGAIPIGSKTRFDSLILVMKKVSEKQDSLLRFVLENCRNSSCGMMKLLKECVSYVEWSMLRRILKVLDPIVGLTQ